MRSTSQPGWMDAAVALIASRSRRLIRFRTTAEPSARPVAMPNRVVSRPVRRNLAARSGWDRMVPRSWSAAKSWGLESVTTRDRNSARPGVRPSGAFDHEPGVRQGRVDRRWTSSGRGSRAPWRDGASWAGRSASSGLRGILSIRPRGLVDGDTTPGGTKRAVAPIGAGAFVVRGMIGPARNGCQTVRLQPAGACAHEGWRSLGERDRSCRPGPTSAREAARYDTPWGYRGIALRGPERGAIFRGPRPGNAALAVPLTAEHGATRAAP